jgi:translation initiation factor 5B
MVKGAVFNQKAPIIIGVDVKDGVLVPGTPLVVPDKDMVRIGKVESIEINKKPVKQARAGSGSATIKLSGDTHIQYGRHFDDSNQLVSQVTRDSIDALKEHFRDEMKQSDWQLIMKLKKQFNIN